MEDAMSEKIERPSSGQKKKILIILTFLLALFTLVEILVCDVAVHMFHNWFGNNPIVLMMACGALLVLLPQGLIWWSIFLMFDRELAIRFGMERFRIPVGICVFLNSIGVSLMCIAISYGSSALRK
jgi:hypothetical protein